MTRIFFSAGDTSGDIHGANVIRALREADPAISCEGLGGSRMAEAGMDLRYDLAGQGIMGFVEVIRRLNAMKRLLSETVAHIETARPACVVVIDFPGFNMRLAKRVAGLHIPVVYYISPQVWAWRRSRIYRIAESVRKMLVILPFEEAIYRDIGMDCTYVGHPLLDHLASVRVAGAYRDDLVIGLLPGSREQEIGRLLGVMIETAQGLRRRYPEARFVVPCVNEARQDQVRRIAQGAAPDLPVETTMGGMYELLDGARFCLVASGTATLETAVFGVPMVILYKVAPASYWLARWLIHVDYIGLVNILAGRLVVPEFIQHQATAEQILPAAFDLIEDTPARQKMREELARVRQLLGAGGASKRAAEEILKLIEGDAHG